VVAALGLAVGAGFYYGALLTAFLVLVSLFVLNKFEKHFSGKRRMAELTILMNESVGGVQSVMGMLEPFGATVIRLTADTNPTSPEGPVMRLQIKVKHALLEKHPEILDRLRLMAGMKQVYYDTADRKAVQVAQNEAHQA
jgi:putative Mg2+ transporter-C (MgtC) family protein